VAAGLEPATTGLETTGSASSGTGVAEQSALPARISAIVSDRWRSESTRRIAFCSDQDIPRRWFTVSVLARKFAKEYFERFPKDRYQTEVESWRHLQSDNIEFTMKRLREPVDSE
jgi:hypothetical protein